MPIYQAIVLGIVQGLTEILPISSSGHLILVPQIFGWAPHSLSFDAALHLGTAAALLVFFSRDWISLLVERQWRTIAAIALASVPVGLLGLFWEDFIGQNFRGGTLVAGALVLVAVLMLVVERWYRRGSTKRKNLTVPDILAVGLAQALALVPGVSRSGITILTGMGRGIERAAAARFSFIISLPIVFAAGFWEVFSVYRDGVLANDWSSFAVGIATSFVVGLFAIKLLFRVLERFSLIPFAVYRILLGATLLLSLLV
ncbi:MAG TPA: undecaprenyl-diphosphate phosphatase [Patescibacteria group bacterium]|nr:undecaprenyl-diphosphate phosphatase [Patescibacteria group bacterium]